MSDFGSEQPGQPPAGPPPGYQPPGPPPGYQPPPGLTPPAPGSAPPPFQPTADRLQPPRPADTNYQQYPGYGAPQQRKKRRVWAWIAGVILLALLGIGGCSFAIFRAVKPAVDASNNLAAAVVDQDFARAAEVASTDPKCFGSDAETELREAFRATPLESYNFSSSSVNTTNGQTTGVVSGTMTFAGADAIPASVSLTKEDGEWKVCGVGW